jgi:hypothetical protein
LDVSAVSGSAPNFQWDFGCEFLRPDADETADSPDRPVAQIGDRNRQQ